MELGKFERIEKTRYYESIIGQFRQLIDSGQLRPGDRVPPERQLSAALSVSRATLREAFRVLERAGLIESRIGQGRFVAELRRPEASVKATSQFLEDAAVFDYLEVRRTLDVSMAGLAAERAIEEDIARLEQALEVPASGDGSPANPDASFAFDLALAEATHNAVYKRFVESELFLLYRLITTNTLLPSRQAQMREEHQAVARAVARHDRRGAEAAMLRHFKNVEASLKRAREGRQ